MSSQSKKLRDLLAHDSAILIPGVCDALSARLAQDAGFEAILAGGYAVSGTMLGIPDLGLITVDEMAGAVRRMWQVVDVPIVADIDTGWGGVLNVRRTIQEIEAAGASAVQIEDQVMPKRAGLTAGRQVVPPLEMVSRLKAATDARTDELVIIARTDAAELTEAIDRANLYREHGADVLFIEDLHSQEDMSRAVTQVDGPLLAVMVEGSGYPFVSAQELEGIGFKVIYYCNSVLFSVTYAARRVLTTLKEKGTTKSLFDSMVQFSDFNDLIGFKGLEELQKGYEEQEGD